MNSSLRVPVQSHTTLVRNSIITPLASSVFPASKKYIDKMVGTYVRLFGSKPTTRGLSPLKKGGHPELYMSKFLGSEETQQYQLLVGAMQWTISIAGCMDITMAVMTMSSFHAIPHQGHLECVKHTYGYLAKMDSVEIHVLTDKPDYSELDEVICNLAKTVMSMVTCQRCPPPPPMISENLSEILVKLPHYFDANLYHDMVNGCSVMGILHLFNKTPINWYSKKQPGYHWTTHYLWIGIHCNCMCCGDQVIDLCLTLCNLSIPIAPIHEKSYMFGNNKTVIDSSMHLGQASQMTQCMIIPLCP